MEAMVVEKPYPAGMSRMPEVTLTPYDAAAFFAGRNLSLVRRALSEGAKGEK